ncbi:hypothetical protein R1sor_020606 [Riccia sorocarpa]|uniref:Ribosomal RNA-processing protein 14 N-terminal domain-containing protein n=1 Tax=Riccia sorocarpa TaxID=122646 RepID=A0ABD3GHZ1_9MARC
MQSNQNYKLLERKTIKEALNARFFALMSKDPSHYLPHTESVKKSRGRAVVQDDIRGEEDDIDEEEVAEDIRQSKRHEKERWDAARKAHKGKGKAIDTSQARKKSQSTPQATKEKLLGSSIAAEKTRLSRQSENDGGRRKREQEEESESNRDDGDARVSDAKEESESPHAKKVGTKRGPKLKTLKEMEPVAGIDTKKQEKRRQAVERCRVSSVPIVIVDIASSS